jgi:hypothetical protein
MLTSLSSTRGELADVASQLTYLVLTPFVGEHHATETALRQPLGVNA